MVKRRHVIAVLVFGLLVGQGPMRDAAQANQDFTQLWFCTYWGGCQTAWFYTEEVTVVASYGELDVWEDGNWGYATCPDCMRMVDEPPPHPEPVDGGEVATPTSLHKYNEQFLSGTPQWCSSTPRYWKIRDYQVRDQNDQPINRTIFMDESFTTGQNTCGVSFVEGDGHTTSTGTFRDNYFMCGSVPACDGGGSCTAVRNQSWKADNNPVGSYTITYTCSNVTITP